MEYKILIVDDDHEILDAIESILNKLGYHTLSADNSDDALSILEMHHKNIIFVLSDFQMPVVNGIEFRKKMIENKLKDIPFAILSAFVDRQMAIDGVDAKICGFLSKPLEVEQLKELLIRETKDRIDELNFSKEIKKVYLQESKEWIEEVEPLLLQLESNPSDLELVNQIYRLIHTIKGGSSVLSQPNFSAYLHKYEDIYSKIKSGKTKANNLVVSVLLKGFDVINSYLSLILEDAEKDFLEDPEDLEINLETKTENQSLPSEEKKSSVQKKKDSISIPMSMMDELMLQSGEITVIRNMVNKLVGAIDKEMQGNKNVRQLEELLDEMHKINSSIQKRMTEIRKVSIGSVYRMIPRTVRDVSQIKGKTVALELLGEDLRVDTVIIQALNNSLVHMVRNSLDHGIETPETRKKFGKSEQGSLTIKSFEESENVVVQIIDDGAGIDPEKIRSKVLEKNMISKEDSLKISDKKILNYIFEPGFSTATEITSISGRGVGMDMVKTSIDQVSGRIDIDSKKGQGTTFTLTIPIPKSVQIIDALIVDIGGEVIAIPQDNIYRLMTIPKEKFQSSLRYIEGSEFYLLEGHLVPVFDGKKILGIKKNSSQEIESRNFIALKTDNKNLLCLDVDFIKDNESVVVKGLEKVISDLKIYKGSTFLNDGSVGLILNIDGLFDFSSAIQNAESLNQISEDKKEQNDYVAFSLYDESFYAIDLSFIFRLEIIHVSNIQKSGDQKIIFYREKIVPIYCFGDLLKVNKKEIGENKEFISLIIILKNNIFYAFEINNLVDIFKNCQKIDSSGIKKKHGIIGHILINGKTHNILSVEEILEKLP